MNVPKKNALEWTVFASAIALIGGTVFAIGREALLREDRPAMLIAETKPAVVQAARVYAVEVVVRNEGDRTAEGVQVKIGDTTLEIPHVPRGSSRTVWATFESDPGPVQATILGYNAP